MARRKNATTDVTPTPVEEKIEQAAEQVEKESVVNCCDGCNGQNGDCMCVDTEAVNNVPPSMTMEELEKLCPDTSSNPEVNTEDNNNIYHSLHKVIDMIEKSFKIECPDAPELLNKALDIATNMGDGDAISKLRKIAADNKVDIYADNNVSKDDTDHEIIREMMIGDNCIKFVKVKAPDFARFLKDVIDAGMEADDRNEFKYLKKKVKKLRKKNAKLKKKVKKLKKQLGK